MSLSVKVVGVTFDWNVFFSSQTTFSTLLKYWQVLQAQELPVDMALERQMRDSLQKPKFSVVTASTRWEVRQAEVRVHTAYL